MTNKIRKLIATNGASFHREALTYATARWGVSGRPACRTNDVVPSRMNCS